jgi:hypothetical protein
MLYQMVKRGLGRLWRSRPLRKRRILFVCATRLSEEDFWRQSATGRWLGPWAEKTRRVAWKISFNNTQGLPVIYNAAIAAARRGDIIVFLHDDVWMSTDGLDAALYQALAHFDVVGVAGNRRRVPFQPAWLFSHIENGDFIWDRSYLSGEVLHGSPDAPVLQKYGPVPAACELLDGVLLAARVHRLHGGGVKFDETFDFHFYDMDFCRTARRANLRLGTWKLDLIHESGGAFGTPGWARNYEKYRAKWAAEDNRILAAEH